LAPRSRASTTHWKPTGWASAMFDPMITMQSAFARSCWKVVAPPLPNEVPKLGTGGVSYARLVLDLHRAHRGEELLDQVVLLVVEGGAAEVGEAERAAQPFLAAHLLPAGLAGVEDAVGDHLHRLLEVELLPLGRVRAAVFDLLQPGARVDQLLGGAALGAEAPAGDRAVRVALDLDHLAVLRPDPLAAADGAVGADRLDHRVGVGGARAQRLRAGRASGLAATGRIVAELAEQRREPHRREGTPRWRGWNGDAAERDRGL